MGRIDLAAKSLIDGSEYALWPRQTELLGGSATLLGGNATLLIGMLPYGGAQETCRVDV
jgi:hypothetical protein